MRTLYESLLDINDVESSLGPIAMIDNWCKDNVNGQYVIDEETLEINSAASITITNNKLVKFPSYIHFGVVHGDFTCSDCTSLTSLEGAPKEVGRDFYCSHCTSLTSLEDIPTHVKGKIYSRAK